MNCGRAATKWEKAKAAVKRGAVMGAHAWTHEYACLLMGLKVAAQLMGSSGAGDMLRESDWPVGTKDEGGMGCLHPTLTSLISTNSSGRWHLTAPWPV